MALTFPRNPIVEFFLDRWRDVSTDVRQSPAITITHGRKDWAAKPSPSRCTFTLDDGPTNGDGDYHPENPLGQWFGLLGRNTPVRVCLGYGVDGYERVSAAGWGPSPDMGTWVGFLSGTASADILSGQARHLITTTSSFIAHRLPISLKRVDLYTETRMGAITVTGGALEPANLMVRGQSTTSYYMLRTSITTGQQVQLQLMYSDSLPLAGPVTVLAYPGAATGLGVRLQADGNTLRGKVWRLDQGEPLGWHIEYSLSPFDPQLGAGWVGIRSGVAGGNSNTKPVQFLYDNTVVRIPRFAGETAKMVPLHDIKFDPVTGFHIDARTTVECSGARRRLSQGEKVLDTALQRYITRGGTPFGVSDLWPLDGEPQTGRPGVNLVGVDDMRFVRATGGALKWGTDTGLIQVQRAVTITPPATGTSGQMFAPIDATKFTAANGYAAVWMQRLGSDRTAAVVLDLTVTQLLVTFSPGIATFQWLPSLTTVMTVGMPQVGDDTVWHMVALGARQSGGNVLFDLMIDGFPYETTLAGTVGVPEGIQFAAFPETADGYEITQVLVITNGMFIGAPWNITLIQDAYLGHAGEPAGTRFARLCAEEGVSSALIGEPALTPAMGPQRPATLLQLVDECVDTAQGSAFDPCGTTGLGMRTVRATMAQNPVLTLDYAGGDVAPVFGPTMDDQDTLNDVTVKRLNGGEYRVEQTAGPMNTADPGTDPDAAGRYDTTVTVNVAEDAQLPDQASWRVHLGTVPGPRYPTVTANLAADSFLADAALTQAALDVGVEDAVTITGAQAARIYDDVRQVVRGYTETIDTAYQHRLVFNTTPASPYDGGILDAADVRLDTDGSTLAADVVAGVDTSMSVTTTGGYPRWTTSAGAFPLRVKAGGVVFTVTNITGAGPTQTFTINAIPANGVIKTVPAGTPVSLANPIYLAP